MTAARTEGRLLPKPRERTVVTPEVRRLLAFWGGNIAAVHRELIAQAAVVFAGGDGCAKVPRREPMLASRVYIWQHAVPLTLTEILATIPAFHPLWEGVDPDLIALVDKQAAHGNFRAWARITQHAAAAGLAAQDRTHIDEHRLRRALAAGGGVELPPAEGVAVVPATPLAGRRAGRTAGPAGQSLARGHSGPALRPHAVSRVVQVANSVVPALAVPVRAGQTGGIVRHRRQLLRGLPPGVGHQRPHPVELDDQGQWSVRVRLNPLHRPGRRSAPGRFPGAGEPKRAQAAAGSPRAGCG
ncbi:hypothetical protein [Kitasatospora herbaricolor]|uniref:hypothetical protein n=1 Tax=Kitasatospora herbaricolor TaxID=68217 RepID=UPI0036DDD83B